MEVVDAVLQALAALGRDMAQGVVWVMVVQMGEGMVKKEQVDPGLEVVMGMNTEAYIVSVLNVLHECFVFGN